MKTVSPVGIRLVVRYAHTTPGSFLTHLSFALPRLLQQAIENGAIVDLSLAIALWVVRCRDLVGDLVLGAVRFIVGYNGVREDEATYDAMPQEFDYLLPCNFGEAQLRSIW